MTVRERVMIIRLSELVYRYSEYAQRIGVGAKYRVNDAEVTSRQLKGGEKDIK